MTAEKAKKSVASRLRCGGRADAGQDTNHDEEMNFTACAGLNGRCASECLPVIGCAGPPPFFVLEFLPLIRAWCDEFRPSPAAMNR